MPEQHGQPTLKVPGYLAAPAVVPTLSKPGEGTFWYFVRGTLFQARQQRFNYRAVLVHFQLLKVLQVPGQRGGVQLLALHAKAFEGGNGQSGPDQMVQLAGSLLYFPDGGKQILQRVGRVGIHGIILLGFTYQRYQKARRFLYPLVNKK
jgi:hypothetical protein